MKEAQNAMATFQKLNDQAAESSQKALRRYEAQQNPNAGQLQPLHRIRSSLGTQRMPRFVEISSVVLRRTLVLCAIFVFGRPCTKSEN